MVWSSWSNSQPRVQHHEQESEGEHGHYTQYISCGFNGRMVVDIYLLR